MSYTLIVATLGKDLRSSFNTSISIKHRKNLFSEIFFQEPVKGESKVDHIIRHHKCVMLILIRWPVRLT